jgi:hypothetical protein
MRDLNDQILDRPFDQELKCVVMRFAELLHSMVATVDRHGLKSRFLRKHRKEVERFFRENERMNLQSEAAIKCKERFERNRDKLFTFLEYDGIPWNNNNAEHAIKAFVRLRNIIGGTSTTKGIREYLILLSITETCKFREASVLEFFLSQDDDVDKFLGRSRRSGR